MSFLNTITIKTPESVELKLTLAGIGSRCVGLLVDYLIWLLVLFLIFMGWAIAAVQFQSWLDNVDDLQLWLLGITLLLLFLVYTSYFVLFETFWQGQTPGKRYAKIRVVQDNGQPVGLTHSILRALIRPIDDLLFVGTFLIIFSQREKRLGDWVAGTLVIQNSQPNIERNYEISEESQGLATQLLSQVNVGALMPDDFAVIEEFLERRGVMESRARANLARDLAEQANELMSDNSLPIRLSPEIFLEAVYLAYQQQSDLI